MGAILYILAPFGGGFIVGFITNKTLALIVGCLAVGFGGCMLNAKRKDRQEYKRDLRRKGVDTAGAGFFYIVMMFIVYAVIAFLGAGLAKLLV
ncbi:MAG: branched-chain amino acid transport system II carrier protein [Desulfarculaceae bacterium]|nr:branched-chain amino acid transport system II carrier protein [Desulfarculaceae bacterium]MCF8073256.1 branched-chain amino acid transport system II carrier protein [Desulfarculaceae bacterium]MCF8100852.1 branched-chain amino acid transport system II carrier protein [Desulfarculaceae bacterium]